MSTGKAVGIDLWNVDHLSGNNAFDVLQNAVVEGVQDKIEVLNADVRSLPFSNKSFDVIVSNECIHNISDFGAVITQFRKL